MAMNVVMRKSKSKASATHVTVGYVAIANCCYRTMLAMNAASLRHVVGGRSCGQRSFILLKQRISTKSNENFPLTAETAAQVRYPATAAYTEPLVKRFSDIPGPRQWPLLGNYPAIHRQIMKTHEAFQSLRQQYGDIFQLRLPGKAPMVVTTNLGAVEQLFRTEGPCPIRTGGSPIDWYFENSDVSPGFLFASGDHWRKLRSAINPQTARRCVMQLTPALNIVADTFIDVIAKLMIQQDDWGTREDLLSLLNSWALEGVSTVILGKPLGALEKDPDPIVLQFKEATLCLIHSITAILYSPPWYKVIPTKSHKDFDSSLRAVHQLGEGILSQRINELQTATKDDRVADVGFLGQWLAEGKLDSRDIIPIVSDFLAAGVDTTAVTMLYVLHELAKNPDVQARLADEVTGVLGSSPVVTEEHIQHLHYLKGCIKESLRLYPSGSILRNLPHDTTLCGYQIPAKTSILIPLYTMGRLHDYFPNANAFDPIRWTKENRAHKPFAYLPFGFGPRACYGRRFAELELTILLAKVSQRFSLETTQRKLELTMKTTLQPVEPVKISFNWKRD